LFSSVWQSKMQYGQIQFNENWGWKEELNDSDYNVRKLNGKSVRAGLQNMEARMTLVLHASSLFISHLTSGKLLSSNWVIHLIYISLKTLIHPIVVRVTWVRTVKYSEKYDQNSHSIHISFIIISKWWLIRVSGLSFLSIIVS
jgi:hypothetical protein